MYTRHTLFFRILLSLLILIGLLWLTLSGWPGADGFHSSTSRSEGLTASPDVLAPLFWQGQAPSPIACTPLTT